VEVEVVGLMLALLPNSGVTLEQGCVGYTHVVEVKMVQHAEETSCVDLSPIQGLGDGLVLNPQLIVVCMLVGGGGGRHGGFCWGIRINLPKLA
jgi:hypothetical protein